MNTHTHTRLTALFPGLPRSAGTRKVNQSGFYWSKRQWVAAASAGTYASLHLAPNRHHASTPPLSFLQAGCPSCRPTNSVKALKAQRLDEVSYKPSLVWSKLVNTSLPAQSSSRCWHAQKVPSFPRLHDLTATHFHNQLTKITTLYTRLYLKRNA